MKNYLHSAVRLMRAAMRKNAVGGMALLMLFATFTVNAQQPAGTKICPGNFVKNSEFTIDADNSPKVTDWIFEPAGDSYRGWKQDDVLIYGENLFVDREGSHTATPVLNGVLCDNTPKFVRFRFNSGNVGPFLFHVKFGDRIVATFSDKGIFGPTGVLPASKLEVFGNVQASVYRQFFPSGKINNFQNGGIWNNVWHEVSLYVMDYVSGDLSFEYVREGGVSRQVRLDDVELYQVMVKPEPLKKEETLEGCLDSFDLTTLEPTDADYVYFWAEDAAGNTVIENPTDVGVGTYYLFAKGCDGSTAATCVSDPSDAVTIKNECCGSNIIENGNFSNDLDSWQGEGVKIVNDKNYNDDASDWRTPPSVGENWLLMTAPTFENCSLKQSVSRSCSYDPKKITFDFVVNEKGVGGTGDLSISLNKVTLGVIEVDKASPHKWRFSEIPSGVKVSIKREDDNSAEPNYIKEGDDFEQFTRIDKKIKCWRYSVEIIVNGDLAYKIEEGGELLFNADYNIRYFFNNISLINLPPIAKKTAIPSGVTTCPTGTFSLKNAEPTTPATPAHVFEWYTDEAGTTPVANPEEVTAGTYYMKTISTCSGCESETLTPFEVVQKCPTVSGTLYSNYTGESGIDGKEGTSGGGMYAHLVNSDDKVLAVTEIAEDGTYSLTASTGSGYRVIISSEKTVKDLVLTTSELNDSYVHAEVDANVNEGITQPFNLKAEEHKENVNFGVQVRPIAQDMEQIEKNKGADVPHQLNQLYGLDDDPNWNDGVGQKIIIKSVTTPKNGSLTYDGQEVEVDMEIPAYEPEKLVFTPTVDTNASVEFTYVFVDIAGAESKKPGVVKYSLFPDPKVKEEIVELGGTYDLTDNVTNMDELPEGTTVEDITPEDAIDVNKVGDYTGRIKVTYPDGSTEELEVPVKVEDPNKLTEDNAALCAEIVADNKRIVVRNHSEEQLVVNVFALTGHQVAQGVAVPNGYVEFAMQSQGVYIVKATSTKTTQTKRVIVK